MGVTNEEIAMQNKQDENLNIENIKAQVQKGLQQFEGVSFVDGKPYIFIDGLRECLNKKNENEDKSNNEVIDGNHILHITTIKSEDESDK